MSKFEKHHRLGREEQEQVLLEFCHALVVVKTVEEAANLLVDLFSRQEMEMVAKRLKVAKLLVDNLTYDEISEKLKVSPATIARVHGWLDRGGAGYRLVIERAKDMKIPPRAERSVPSTWGSVKRKYPMYFWPQLLLEDVVRSANRRQRERLLNTVKILKTAGEKHVLFRQIERQLRKGT